MLRIAAINFVIFKLMDQHYEIHKNDIFLSLGSNMGNRGDNLKMALMCLEQWGILDTHNSSIYESEPFGKKDQPDFYNMVVKARVNCPPADLLTAILAVERSLGRERKEKWGPRTIDIDILYYGSLVVDEKGLTIPHPGIAERKFVLVPLCEIAPDFVHPVLKKTSKELLMVCKDTGKVSLLS